MILLWLLLACTASRDIAQGEAALFDHELSAAEAHFRAALAKEPANTVALAGLGWTYTTAGERKAAEGAFARCVELDPAALSCLRGLAAIAAQEGDLAGAAQRLARAARVSPEDPGVRSSQALLALRGGDLVTASATLEALTAAHPAEAEYAASLAEVRLAQGRPAEALPLTEAALQLPESPKRVRAALLLIQARALVAATARQEDPARCAETLPPVLAWLDRAGQSIDAAEALLGVNAETAAVRRLLLGRRSVVTEACPAQ